MRTPSFGITTGEYAAGVVPCISHLSMQLPYNRVAKSSVEAVASGNEGAYYVPAVRYILDATLGVMTQPSVNERLPVEVGDRSLLAEICAQRIAEEAAETGIIRSFYQNNRYLGPRFNEEASRVLMNPNYLEPHGAAIFQDVAIVAGGALRILQERGRHEPSTRIITQSKGLLAIAGISRANALQARNWLGNPYAKTENLTVRGEGDRTSVSLTPAALTTIKQFFKSGGGCPARNVQIKLGHQPRTPYIHHGWESVVNYLVPDNATATVPQDSFTFHWS